MTNQETDLNNEPNRRRNPVILVGGFLFLLGALVILIFGGSLFSNGEPNQEQELAGEPAPASAVQLPVSGPPLQVGDRPYEFALQDTQGNVLALSQFIGQPILVNFWATWCGPCRIEMPEIQAAFEAYQSQGLVVLALDQAESSESVSAYFDELGLTFTPLLDDESSTARSFGLQGTLPASIFINPEGEVSVIHRGIMTKGQLDGFLAQTIPGHEVASANS